MLHHVHIHMHETEPNVMYHFTMIEKQVHTHYWQKQGLLKLQRTNMKQLTEIVASFYLSVGQLQPSILNILNITKLKKAFTEVLSSTERVNRVLHCF